MSSAQSQTQRRLVGGRRNGSPVSTGNRSYHFIVDGTNRLASHQNDGRGQPVHAPTSLQATAPNGQATYPMTSSMRSSYNARAQDVAASSAVTGHSLSNEARYSSMLAAGPRPSQYHDRSQHNVFDPRQTPGTDRGVPVRMIRGTYFAHSMPIGGQGYPLQGPLRGNGPCPDHSGPISQAGEGAPTGDRHHVGPDAFRHVFGPVAAAAATSQGNPSADRSSMQDSRVNASSIATGGGFAGYPAVNGSMASGFDFPLAGRHPLDGAPHGMANCSFSVPGQGGHMKVPATGSGFSPGGTLPAVSNVFDPELAGWGPESASESLQEPEEDLGYLLLGQGYSGPGYANAFDLLPKYPIGTSLNDRPKLSATNAEPYDSEPDADRPAKRLRTGKEIMAPTSQTAAPQSFEKAARMKADYVAKSLERYNREKAGRDAQAEDTLQPADTERNMPLSFNLQRSNNSAKSSGLWNHDNPIDFFSAAGRITHKKAEQTKAFMKRNPDREIMSATGRLQAINDEHEHEELESERLAHGGRKTRGRANPTTRPDEDGYAAEFDDSGSEYDLDA